MFFFFKSCTNLVCFSLFLFLSCPNGQCWGTGNMGPFLLGSERETCVQREEIESSLVCSRKVYARRGVYKINAHPCCLRYNESSVDLKFIWFLYWVGWVAVNLLGKTCFDFWVVSSYVPGFKIRQTCSGRTALEHCIFPFNPGFKSSFLRPLITDWTAGTSSCVFTHFCWFGPKLNILRSSTENSKISYCMALFVNPNEP